MKVLLVSNMYTYPGHWDKLNELGRYVELAVVTPDRWHTAQELHPVARVPHQSHATWVHYPLPVYLQGNPFRYFYHARPLARVLAAFKADLVFAEQEPESLSLLQLSFYKLRYRYRLVFLAWENVNPLRLGWLFRKLNFHLADGAIFGNRAALARAARMGFHKWQVLIPQYGFHVAAPVAPVHDQHRPFTVGFAGRLVPEKGIGTLLEAAHQLPDIKLLIAGGGPLAEQLQSEPQVSLLGTLPRDAMAGFWQSIDAFVLPSLTTRKWAEQFGRVLLEAMAAGVPVIGSDSAAIPEVIGDAGLVVPEADAQALTNAIKRLRDEPALRACLAARGIERVASVYSHDVVWQQTRQFFDDMLKPRGAIPRMRERSHAAQR